MKSILFRVSRALLVFFVISGCTSVHKLEEGDTEEFFQIAVLPDTQYYTSQKHGGTMEMFEQQIDWILENYKKENIKYVVHLGDLVEHGEQDLAEWERAKNVMYRLEKPLPDFPEGIPYGIAVGNHDQQPKRNPAPDGTDEGYNIYFGRDRFEGRSYYGGAFGKNDNDNHFNIFEAGGEKFLVLYIEYNENINEYYDSLLENEVFDWAENVLEKYSTHKVIIVSHSLLKRPEGSNSITIAGLGNNDIQGEYTRQGEKVYERFKHSPNVFMMLCGHRSGEGYRKDIFNGHTIKTYLSDYQSRTNSDGSRNGGNGLMRLMKFNTKDQTLEIKTFAPRADGKNVIESDGDSFFIHDLYE